MSEYESWTGKVRKVNTMGLSIHEFVKSILSDSGWSTTEIEEKFNYWGDEIHEIIDDVLMEQYLIIDEKLYHVLSLNSEDPDSDIFNATIDKNNTIDFNVKYYNGGCGLEEAIGIAIKNIEK